jgi:hypothetical protein
MRGGARRVYVSLTLPAPDKVTPLCAFSPFFPHYDHHSAKRLADALTGDYCVEFIEGIPQMMQKSERLRARSLQPQAWVYGQRAQQSNR